MEASMAKHQHHLPAIFIADAPGLDFLNSISPPVDEVFDWLHNGDGLISWLDQAKLVPADALEALRAGDMTGELDNVADQARSLREWFRGFVHDHMGRPLTADALGELALLNRLLERDETFSQFTAQDNGGSSQMALRIARRWHNPESLLLPIAETIARFICEEAFTDVKVCEGELCTFVFADHSAKKDRRWCSMAVCGNRAKQAAHRSRLKSLTVED
jgi:predicted RNA-binding Zn ribbon-like protein